MLSPKASMSEHGTYSVNEERINAITHGIGFVLALAGLVALVVKSSSFYECAISVLYGASLSLMFLSSTAYHATKDINRRAYLRKLDHTAIYLLIAGTYTPFLLLAVDGDIGFYGALVVWIIGLAGIFFKLTLGYKYPKLGVATYAFMGWLVIFLIYPVYQALSGTGFILLLAGGLGYSFGIPFYMLKSRHFSHAIWHVFVVIGAACHFFAIYYYVLS